jgi:hypothetical protein
MGGLVEQAGLQENLASPETVPGRFRGRRFYPVSMAKSQSGSKRQIQQANSAVPGSEFLSRLRQAGVPEVELPGIAEAWREECDAIFTRMLQISAASDQSSLHVDARPATIFELAKFMCWFTNRFASSRLGAGDPRGC